MHKRKKLVLLPGWGNDSDTLWQSQIGYLAEQFDISTLVVTDQTTACGMAREVIRRAPNKFTLLGHSLGGLVAQHVALNAPQRVERLILVSTFSGKLPKETRNFFKQCVLAPLLTGKWSETSSYFNNSCHAQNQATERTLLQTLTSGQKMSHQGLINQTRALIGARDMSRKLAKVDIPTLIIHGRQDQLFNQPMQDMMFAYLPHCTVKFIDDCGHIPSLEHPEQITQLVSSWLSLHQNLADITNLIDRLSLQLMTSGVKKIN
ncbi:alpha/beta fold hydrolase [Pseudomonas koreensis]|uniref:alpha/beta fold hydrolase n=1 Tax=Pseudomonas koreensis TaxID=198620 RepID=UPI003F842F3D